MKNAGDTPGAVELPLEPWLVRFARLVAPKSAMEWFGPGPTQPAGAPPEVEGRQFQLPINANILIQTKTEGIGYSQLRAFADSADIVRILIENRKDVICSLAWSIEEIAGQEAPGPKEKSADAEQLEAFFRYPDVDHCWADWLRMLLEDELVLDAPTLYVQTTRAGDLYALRPIDGATVKRVIDGHGWTPQVPDIAYQQVLQGQIATSYTVEELIYLPRNIRTNKIYGYSRVEQLIVAIQLWLRRQASNLEYYDSSNTPDGFLTASASWSAKQIAEYQDLFDTQLTGQLGARRKVKVVPPDAKYTPTKEPALKNDYDELLIRLACFCFGTSPTPFIKQMNRATAESSKESATEEGVQSDMQWVKRLLDNIIQRRLGFTNLEFQWKDREAQDPLERAQVDQIYLQEKVITPDEVRVDLNREPLTEEQKADLSPPEPQQLGPDGKPIEQPPGSQPPKGAAKPPAKAGTEKVQKFRTITKRQEGRPVFKFQPDLTGEVRAIAKSSPRVFPPLQEQERVRLAHAYQQLFAKLRESVPQQFLSALEKAAGAEIQKAEDEQPAIDPDQLAAAISLDDFTLVWEPTSNVLEAVAEDGTKIALASLTAQEVEEITQDITDLANKDAVAWARQHAGELLGKDASGGQLQETTRYMLRRAIAQGLAEKLTPQEIAARLMDEYAFSDERALLIAETEVGTASANGQLQGYKAAGLQQKEWLLSNDEGVCPICEVNADAGWIDIDKSFPGGVQAPLQHPRCRCALVARRRPTED